MEPWWLRFLTGHDDGHLICCHHVSELTLYIEAKNQGISNMNIDIIEPGYLGPRMLRANRANTFGLLAVFMFLLNRVIVDSLSDQSPV